MNEQIENLNTPDCIRTVTGLYVNVFEPKPEMICITDIAHALSQQCRFGGHLSSFYSVAEHSWYCSQLVKPKHQLAALLHDASEAYLLDIPSPIKRKLTNYAEIEDKLMRVIADKFGFKYPLHDDVHFADTMALTTEWHTLMLKDNKAPFLTVMSCYKAKLQFLNTYNQLKEMDTK